MASAATLQVCPITMTDPLDRLPYDLWVKCICLATYNVADGPLLLLAVSQRWQANVLETPEVWTYIEINNSVDEDVRIHTFCHLSGQCLFDVRIILPLINLKALSLIKEAGTRLRTILFNHPMQWVGPYFLGQAMELLFSPSILHVVYSELVEINYDQINGPSYKPYSTLLNWCPKLRLVPMFNLEDWSADIVRRQKLESFGVWLDRMVERLTIPEEERLWVSFLRMPTTTLKKISITANAAAALSALI